MYGQGKGISKSSMPYKKVPPRWLTIDSSEVTKLIENLAKKGFKPSQIGVILRFVNILLFMKQEPKQFGNHISN